MANAFFMAIQRYTLGLIRARRWGFALGPVVLLDLAAPEPASGGISWPIQGGLLARPGGRLELRWESEDLSAEVIDFTPRLPLPLYNLTQLPVHHLVTRFGLLQLRGRQPRPGFPVRPLARITAGAIDAAICAAFGAWLLRRGRPGLALTGIVAYHLCFWSLGGTPVDRLCRQRVVAVDGSPPTPAQAAVRLAALPLAWMRLRAVHDEIAGTDLIRA